MTKIAVFCIVLISSSALSEDIVTTAKEEDTLVLLHVLFRHGNRTPDKISQWPKDVYVNYTYYPVGLSQLTPLGKRREYAIGQYIRQNYGHFIPKQFTPDVVYAISTNFKRTKASLELVLSGTFPPIPTDDFEPNLNWQPISFNIEQAGGIIGAASLYCTNFITAYYTYRLSKEGQAICDQYKALYNKLSQYTGLDINDPSGVLGIYVTLKSEQDYGLKLPPWSEGLFPDILEQVASISYELQTSSSTLKKLSTGFLLKKILEDSIAKKNGTLPAGQKLFLYSAHEFNVATMLRALNVWFRHVPPFGATIFFEIHNIKGVYGLKLYYQDYRQPKPKLLTIPGCSSVCPLEDVLAMVDDSLPNGPADVCEYTTELM